MSLFCVMRALMVQWFWYEFRLAMGTIRGGALIPGNRPRAPTYTPRVSYGYSSLPHEEGMHGLYSPRAVPPCHMACASDMKSGGYKKQHIDLWE